MFNYNYKCNYKNSVDLESRKKFSEIILKRHDFVPVVIEGTSNKKWINKEYYKKTELQYILLDIIYNCNCDNIKYLTFQIGSTVFPQNTTLEEIYSIYKDKEDNILYLMLIKTNSGIFSKLVNLLKIAEYKIYKIRDNFFKKQQKIENSPYYEIL